VPPPYPPYKHDKRLHKKQMQSVPSFLCPVLRYKSNSLVGFSILCIPFYLSVLLALAEALASTPQHGLRDHRPRPRHLVAAPGVISNRHPPSPFLPTTPVPPLHRDPIYFFYRSSRACPAPFPLPHWIPFWVAYRHLYPDPCAWESGSHH
jgi:hypothetical protein